MYTDIYSPPLTKATDFVDPFCPLVETEGRSFHLSIRFTFVVLGEMSQQLFCWFPPHSDTHIPSE